MAEGTDRLASAGESVGTPRTLLLLREWAGLPVSMLAALATALHYVRSPEVLRPTWDDSYITLIFARNLAEHGKLSYDGVGWATGATSPLHVALLAVPIKLGAEPVFTAIAMGVAFSVLLAAAVYLLAWAVFRSHFAS